jgi:hypothetical protein
VGAAFETALALEPDLAQAHNDLGALLAREGEVDAAIARRVRAASRVEGKLIRAAGRFRLVTFPRVVGIFNGGDGRFPDSL